MARNSKQSYFPFKRSNLYLAMFASLLWVSGSIGNARVINTEMTPNEYIDGTSYTNTVLIAQGRVNEENTEYTVSITKDSTFSNLNAAPISAWTGNNLRYAFTALSASEATLNLKASEEATPTITISTAGTPYIKTESASSKPSIYSSNYAIVAESNGHINIDGINLVLDGVLEGIWAGANSIYSNDPGSVTIQNNEQVTILVGVNSADESDGSNIQRHGIATYNDGTVNILNSKNVYLHVSGDASYEKDDPISVYSAGLYQAGGGTINITGGENVTIVVDTKNDDTSDRQNFGVYAIGQSGSSTKETPGNITLSGSDQLFIDVSGASNGNYGIVSNADHYDSTVSAKFKNIEIIARSSDQKGDYGLYADSNQEAIYSVNNQKAEITLEATGTQDAEDEGNISIIAENGIGSLSRVTDSLINVTATNQLDINSSHAGVISQSQYGGKTETNLSASNINVKNATYGFYSDISRKDGVDVDFSNKNTVVNTINANASKQLSVDATFVALAHTADSDAQGNTSLINLNTAENAGTTVLSGAVYSDAGSQINIGLNDGNSSWTGFAQDNRGENGTDAGEINVVAKGGATWYVKLVNLDVDGNSIAESKSYITSWTSGEGGSNIDLRLFKSESDSNYETYQAVDIGTLSGSDTTFYFNTNVDGARGEGKSTDQAIIHSGEGSHYIYVQSTGSGTTDAQKDYLVLHLEEPDSDGKTYSSVTRTMNPNGTISVGDGDGLAFSLVDSSGKETDAVSMGLYRYGLVTRGVQDEDVNGTEWYLARVTSGNTPDTNEGKTVTALAGTGAKLSMYYAQLDDLRKRLGEVRYGAQEGPWARFVYHKDRFEGTSAYGAKQEWYGLNVGVDHIVTKNEDRMWLLGGNFKYGHADQRLLDRSSRGTGDLNSYGLNLYATYADHTGGYADFVLTFDKYHQDIGARIEDGTSASGKFNTWGWGASVEAGKMFSTADNDEGWGRWHNHWWVEPQAQLSYYWIKGKDWAMSNGMTTDQDNGQSLVGRLGVVIGKHIGYGNPKESLDKRYSQFYLKGGVRHEFLGKQDVVVNGVTFDDDLKGTTGYYGAGFDWNVSKDVKAYAQVERESGGKYKKDIEFSIGLKKQF